MKLIRTFGIIALLTAAGCSVRVPDGYDPPVALRFDPVLSVATKASSSTKWPEGLEFGVSLWDYPKTGKPEDGGVWLSDTRVTQNGDYWIPITETLWPSKDRYLHALAYAPYGVASSLSLERGVEFHDAGTGIDLLYAAPETGLRKYVPHDAKDDIESVISLTFRHALCLVDVSLRCNASPTEQAEVLSITLDDAYVAGDFQSLPTPSWVTTGATTSLTFFNGDEKLSKENNIIGNSLLMIPQPLSGKFTVKIRYAAYPMTVVTEHTLDSSPIGKVLESGRHYTFSLSCLLETMTLKIDVIDMEL